jgi:hypothetical protein
MPEPRKKIEDITIDRESKERAVISFKVQIALPSVRVKSNPVEELH